MSSESWSDLPNVLHRVQLTLLSFMGHTDGPSQVFQAIHSEFRQRLGQPDTVSGDGSLTKEAEFFKTSLCCFYMKGVPCPKGSACTYAHGVHELRTFKTALCKEFALRGSCVRGRACTFAHGEHELRYRDDLAEVVSKLSTNLNFQPAIVAIKKLKMGDRLRLREALRKVVGDMGGAGHVREIRYAVLRVLPQEAMEESDFDPTIETLLLFSILYSTEFLTDLQALTISLIPTQQEQQQPKDMMDALLAQAGASQYINVFRQHGIDYHTLLLMKKKDFAQLTTIPPQVSAKIVGVTSGCLM